MTVKLIKTKAAGYLTAFVASLVLNFAVSAGPLEDEILTIQQTWAKANYLLTEDEQEKAFEALVEQGEKLTQSYPERAESWVWSGIIKSSFGGAKGGMGALSLAKAAKVDLDKAIEIDGAVLNGSAYASLGVLYFKVPGWPIGFGDDDKAEELLKKAVAVNPDGMESNYFYADFLADDRQYEQAKEHLLIAQKAAPQANRPIAYEYRQKEIAVLLAEVEKRLAKAAKRKNKH